MKNMEDSLPVMFMYCEVHENPVPNCQDTKKPKMATPTYKLVWYNGARKIRSIVPRRHDIMQMTRRELGSITVASHILIKRPKHIPLL